MLRAIRMCLRPIVDNRDITPRLLVSLGCASGTNYTSGNITSLSNFRPNLRDRNQYFKKLGPSASLWAIRMCLRPKLDNGNNTLASLDALGCASGLSLCSCIIA